MAGYQWSGVEASAPGKMYLDMKRPQATSCQLEPCRRPDTWSKKELSRRLSSLRTVDRYGSTKLAMPAAVAPCQRRGRQRVLAERWQRALPMSHGATSAVGVTEVPGR